MTQFDHQSMNTVVQAAFRRTLDRFDAALASFPANSQQRADELSRAWDFSPTRCMTTTTTRRSSAILLAQCGIGGSLSLAWSPTTDTGAHNYGTIDSGRTKSPLCGGIPCVKL
jgi:hypothetical protein